MDYNTYFRQRYYNRGAGCHNVGDHNQMLALRVLIYVSDEQRLENDTRRKQKESDNLDAQSRKKSQRSHFVYAHAA